MAISITLLEGYHLTATERRHIAQMIETGMNEAHSKIKSYALKAEEPGKYRVQIQTPDRDSQNRKIIRTSRAFIAVKCR